MITPNGADSNECDITATLLIHYHGLHGYEHGLHGYEGY